MNHQVLNKLKELFESDAIRCSYTSAEEEFYQIVNDLQVALDDRSGTENVKKLQAQLESARDDGYQMAQQRTQAARDRDDALHRLQTVQETLKERDKAIEQHRQTIQEQEQDYHMLKGQFNNLKNLCHHIIDGITGE